MKQIFNFEGTASLSLENSFVVLRSEDNVKLHCTIGINEPTYGWFEFYDSETEGEEWYAEGGLWIDGKKITGYDGVYAIPLCITDKLKELGYDVSEIEDTE